MEEKTIINRKDYPAFSELCWVVGVADLKRDDNLITRCLYLEKETEDSPAGVVCTDGKHLHAWQRDKLDGYLSRVLEEAEKKLEGVVKGHKRTGKAVIHIEKITKEEIVLGYPENLWYPNYRLIIPDFTSRPVIRGIDFFDFTESVYMVYQAGFMVPIEYLRAVALIRGSWTFTETDHNNCAFRYRADEGGYLTAVTAARLFSCERELAEWKAKARPDAVEGGAQ